MSSKEIPVNPELLKKLMDMGINENVAKKALQLTNNESLELASSLALDLSDGDLEEDVLPYQVIFIINDSLKMKPGDLAVQVIIKTINFNINDNQVADAMLKIYHEVLLIGIASKDIIDSWRLFGERKRIFKAPNEKKLEEIFNVINEAQIPSVLVKAGHGISAIPKGSITVLAFMGSDRETDPFIHGLQSI